MHRIGKVIILCLFVLGWGCSRDAAAVPRVPLSVVGPNANLDIQGAWQSCGDAGDFGVGVSALTKLRIELGHLNRDVDLTTTGDCSGSPDVRIVTASTYRAESGIVSSYLLIDIVNQTLSVTPLTTLGATLLNLADWCGARDWTVGRAKVVTPLAGGPQCFPRAPASVFDIFSVEASSEGDRLYFGRGIDLRKPERRPMELNRTRFYKRI